MTFGRLGVLSAFFTHNVCNSRWVSGDQVPSLSQEHLSTLPVVSSLI